jgi:hypothetical protein
MTQEEKIHELSSMLAYAQLRLEEFYNMGLYSNNPTRKEIFFLIKDSKKVLDRVKDVAHS